MSYNPNRHGPQAKHVARQRIIDPKAGKRHSDIMRSMGPRGTNIEDIRKREATPHGWRIPYFVGGDEFEMYYEYLCARNGTGILKSADHDRCVRVLAGMLFVSMDSKIITLYAGQAIVLEKGTEYELATSGDGDAELLIAQGTHYEETVEHLTCETASNTVMSYVPKDAPSRDDRVDSTKAKMQAAQMRAARNQRRQPVPKKKVTNELGEEVPPPSGTAPLAGQTVIGVNPKPVGAGGYEK